MRSRAAVPSCLLAFLLLSTLLLPGSSPGEPPAPAWVKDGSETRPVAVVASRPTGMTRDPVEITIKFNQAMVALDAVAERVKELDRWVTVTPKIPGSFHWLGTDTLTWKPDKPFPLSTRFDVLVRQGFPSAFGNTLPADHTFSFSTQPIRVLGITPGHGATSVGVEPEIGVWFDQSFDPGELARNLTLGARGQPPVPLTVERARDDKGREIPIRAAVKVKEKLTPGTGYVLAIQPSFHGDQGPLPMGNTVQSPFTTYFPLIVRPSFGPCSVGFSLVFNNPVSPKMADSHTRVEPAVPFSEREGDYASAGVSSGALLEPESTYRVNILKGLKDVHGNELPEDHSFTITTASLPPRLDFVQQMAAMEVEGPHKVPYTACNLPGFFLTVERFPTALDAALGRNAVTVRERVPLDPRPKRSRLYGLDLDKYLAPGSRTGLFRLTASETYYHCSVDCSRYERGRLVEKRPCVAATTATVQLTGMALSARMAPERRLVWVTSLRTGKPVEGATVAGYQVEWQRGYFWQRGEVAKVEKTGEAVTGPDGLAELPGGNVFTAEKAGDQAYLHADRSSHSPWEFSVPSGSGERSRAMGFLFTDRAIYRPGEEVCFKGWMRNRTPDGLYNLAGQTVTVRATDRKGQELFRREVALSEFGGFDGKFSLPANVPLGPCGIVFYPGTGEPDGRKTRVFMASFTAAEYRVPEFEVTVAADKPEYVVGDTFTGTVTGRYLFGAPMPGAKATWSLRRTPTWFAPPGWNGYHFSNWAGSWQEGGDGEGGPLTENDLLAEGEGTLEEQGTLEVRHTLAPSNLDSDYSITLEAAVTDVNRQEISGRLFATVHAAEYSLGMRPSTTLVAEGKELAVALVAADPKGRQVPGREATVTLIRREWNTVRKMGTGGWWQYESKPVDTVAAEQKVTLADGTGSAKLRVPKGGEYILRAESRDGRGNRTVCSSWLWCYGPGYVPWRMGNDNRVDLVPEKTAYRPGETARILVKNPLGPCTALLTVEREGIIERRVVPVADSAPVFEVPIREAHIPNLFVSVVLVAGRTAEELDKEGNDAGRPAYRAGSVQLGVSTDSKRLTVAVSAPEKAEPGEKVTVRVFVTDAAQRPVRAEVALLAVDEGVLSLTGYRTPDPLGYFWSPEGLAVRFGTSLDFLLSRINYQMKGANPGGGGKGAGAWSRVRGKFITTPVFLPSLVTGADGQAQAEFELPDNLTRFRVMAVAVDWKERFGAGERGITVAKPLMATPSLPRFANLGDSFRAGVVVHNQSGAERKVTVSVKGEGITLPVPLPYTVTVPDGKGVEVLFPLLAEKPGEAVLTFAAVAGSHSDRVRYRFPVQLPRSKEVVAAYGVVSEKGGEKVTAPRGVFPDAGGLTLSIGSTALTGLEEAVDALVEYPHGCLEQQLSRLVPLVALRDLVREFALTGKKVDLRKMDEEVAKYTGEIPLYQNEAGAMRFWKDSGWASPYLSGYCLEYLRTAGALGEKNALATLEGETGRRLVAYLQELLRRNRTQQTFSWQEEMQGFCRIGPIQRAYIAWLLARNGTPDAVEHDLLWRLYQAEPAALRTTGRLYLLGALAQSKAPQEQTAALVKDLDRMVTETAEGAYLEDILNEEYGDWYYLGSRTVHTALAVDILSRYAPDSVSIPKMARYLMRSRINGRWRTTHEGARCLLALVTYYRAFEAEPPDFSYRVELAGKPVQEGEHRKRNTRTATTHVPMSELLGLSKADLSFAKKGKGLLYYGAHLAYYPTARSLPPMDEGFRVERAVTPLAGGEPGDSFAAGDQLKVTLTVTTTKPRHYVVIEDPLPAGVEAVDSSLATANRAASGAAAKGTGWRPQGREGDAFSPGGPGGEEYYDDEEGGTYYGGPYFGSEVRDDRVVVYADYLPPGVFTYSYAANAIHHGEYYASPTRAEEMYNPEAFGRGAAGKFTVR